MNQVKFKYIMFYNIEKIKCADIEWSKELNIKMFTNRGAAESFKQKNPDWIEVELVNIQLPDEKVYIVNK